MVDIRETNFEAHGVQFHALEAGSGELALCLHGFPNNARSFTYLIQALAESGYRAVAPFMRGYAPTGMAPDGKYHSALLSMDILAMIEVLGYKSAVVIGHDWGAIAAYGAAAIAPDKIDKLVTMSIPHLSIVNEALFTNFELQKSAWHVFFFQMPFAGEAVKYNDFAFIEQLWRHWSPGWEIPRDLLEDVKSTFRNPGVIEAALSYYRHTFNPSFHDPSLDDIYQKISTSKTEVPTLAFHGSRDGVVSYKLTEGMERYFSQGFKQVIIEEAGHFLYLEKPAEVKGILLEFLR
jgi:pimeloyl-ACP methyl ester carboxylesterase